MKTLRRIVSIAIWTIVGLYVAALLLSQVPGVQAFIGSQAAKAIANKLGTRVSIGRVEPGLFNRVIIDDVTIYDQQGKKMLVASRLTAKIDLAPLAEGRISLSSSQVFGAHLQLYRQSANAKPNYQFALDSLASKDTTSHNKLDLRVNSFIMRHSSLAYNRLDAPTTPGKLNADHLNISGISAHIILKALNDDSLNINIKRVAFKEHSGLNVNKLALKFEAGKSRCRLSGLHIEMPGTNIVLNEATATYKSKGNTPILASLQYSGRLDESQVSLADFAFLAPTLGKIGKTINLSADFHGTSTNLWIDNASAKTPDGEMALSADGWIRNWETKPIWHATIKRLETSGETIAAVMEAAGKHNPNVTGCLADINHISLRGVVGATRSKTLAASCSLSTDIGDADATFSLSNDNTFSSHLSASGINLKQLLGNDKLGSISADIDARGQLKPRQSPALSVKGTISKFDYNKYTYSNLYIAGNSDGIRMEGLLKADDPNLAFDIEGSLKKGTAITDVELKASVIKFRPRAVNLTDRWGDAEFKAEIAADFNASGLNDAKGNITVSNMTMTQPNDTFTIASTKVKSGYDGATHFLALNSDFGSAELTGEFEYKTLAQSFINIISDKLPTLPGLPKAKRATGNDFRIKANISDTQWLNKLFGIQLHAHSPISIDAMVDDSKRDMAVNCRANDFSYGETNYKDGAITVRSEHDTLVCNVGVKKLSPTGATMEFKGESRAINNSLSTSFSWDNHSANRFSGMFNAASQFYRDGSGAQVAEVSVKPSHINIGDVVWDILPSNIRYSNKNIEINNFAIKHKEQHIAINGKATPFETDSLVVDLQGIDLKYALDLVNFHSVEFSGIASGRAFVTAPFGNTAASGKITVEQFKFEDGRMGVLDANVEWNKTDKQIDIYAIANDGPDAMTFIDGYVSPARKYIDLGINAAGTHIDFLESFTSSFMAGVSGHAHGNIRVIGPLKKINLIGKLTVNGETTLTPTNCKYYLRGDTIAFVPNEIMFVNAPIYDVNNNRGVINGSIHHNYLKNLSYDLSVNAENLLGYDFRDFGDNSFYGTVYASGQVDIHGKKGDVNIGIDITPLKNSTFVYNVSNPDAVTDQTFIKWNDASLNENGSKSRAEAENELPTEDIPSDMHINFLLNCTPDITIKLLMDSRANDYITLNGNGTLRATYYNKGSFSMFGTYTVQHGTYGITIQDIIKKNFTFNEGSSITFRGNPYYAELDLQAVHTVNGVSLSDLNVGNSFTNNTIRVNCLMNISGQPQKPAITFDLDMPTVSSDEKQMIRSIINSEDEMNQQVLYLLGIGRFYPQRENNAAAQNEEQQSQTSLAMQSLLSGTISTQINTVLNSVIKSNNWNFGANISTGDEGWNNAEYEGLLSGRLLDNRLLINGQFGYRDNANTANTSFIGDFDIRYLLKPNGNLAIKVYNQTNDRYFTKSSLNTQGIGIIMKKDFNGFRDLLNIKKKKKEKDNK